MFFSVKPDKEKLREKILKHKESKEFCFRALDLRKLVFNNLDLSGVDFSQSNLSGGKFIHCNLQEVLFSGAILEKAYFQDCSFEKVNFSAASLAKSIFKECSFKDINSSDVVLTNAFLVSCVFKQIIFMHSCFSETEFKSCGFESFDAQRCVFEDSRFTDSKITESNFTASIFTGSRWSNTDFDGVSLAGVTAYGMEVVGFMFTSVNFTKADFRNSVSLPEELRKEIILQEGLITPRYFKLLWANLYGKVLIILSIIGLVFFFLQFFFNPSFWSMRKLSREVQKAIDQKHFFKAQSILNSGFKRQLTLDESGELRLFLAQIYLNKGNRDLAIKLYTEIAAFPLDKICTFSARSRLADIYLREGNFPKAIRLYQEVIEFAPLEMAESQDWDRLNLADIYNIMGESKLAQELYENLANTRRVQNKIRVEAKIRIVDILLKNGKKEEGLQSACKLKQLAQEKGQREKIESLIKALKRLK